jgi:replicative DNA helicase
MSDTNNPFNKEKVEFRAKKMSAETPSHLYGKVQPQALPLEEAVLGAIMLDKDALPVVLDIITAQSFYLDAHQEIYRAMLRLFEKTQPVDLLTVTEELKKGGVLDKVGGPYYLVELTNRVASAANIEYHARIISQKHIQRELIRVSTKVIKDAFEDTTDVFNLLDEAEQGLFNITQHNLSRSYESMGTLTSRALKQLEELSKKTEGLTGVPTGFTDLDRLTSGWQPSDLIIVAARPGMGKCLGKGTKVLMYDGSLKKVEDIQEGELLMGDDSTPRKVLSLARGQERMYWVRQNKGIDYRVNESHILSLKRSRTEGPHQNGDVLNISVKDYLDKADKFKTNYKGYKVAVDFEEQQVPLPPYFLGLWLGDGVSSKSEISTTDKEVVDYLEGYASALGLSLKQYQTKPEKCPQYNITGGYTGNKGYSLKTALREIGVLNNKHIPPAYLVNSTEKRLELLAGLIDSDGHYNVVSNGYEITQKKEDLARDIKFLCDSLGFRTSFIPKTASIKSIGYETEVYRVRIYGDVARIPVKVKRKEAKPWKSPVNWQVTGIQVEYDKVDDYYGFEIDGNKLFLLEDMTVTHNTSFTLALARNAAVDFGKGVALFSLEMSNVQLVQRLISMEAEISSSKLRNGQLEDYEWQQLQSAIEKMSEVPIYIDDTPGINIFELRAKCRRMKMQHDIQMVIIDYLQLMSGGPDSGKGNREQEISSISRSLKSLAKELNVPVIALSQLSRAVETRGGNKRPMLSDLRECITGDTLIYRPDSGAYQRVDELLEEKNFEVLAMNKQLKLEKANCLEVWATGEKDVYEVETQSGHIIRASLNHPFYTIDGWQELVDIKEGDYVATSRFIEGVKGSSLKDEEIILLAHMIGDGCYVARQPIHYTSQEKKSLEIVSACAKTLWNIESRLVKDAKSAQCYQLYLPSPFHLTHGVKHPFSLLLKKVGLEKARSFEKKIPPMIFESDNRQTALFIQHLWSTDGGVHIRQDKGASKIHYASNSFELIKGLKSLLLRFGIQSSIQKTEKEGYKSIYNLNITGKPNILLFAHEINIFGSKSEKLDRLLEQFEEVTTNTNSDVVPKGIWNEVRKIRKESDFSERAFQAALDMSYCGTTLYKSNLSRERLQRVSTILNNEQLELFANSDIKWEKIKSITHIGKEMTYDLHVEEHHNFVANDFIIHNSGAIEQDADIVSFIYRPEYYAILEDEEGNSLKGIGEIIIAKHRNGALDTVKLKFTDQYAKFTNLDDPDFRQLLSSGGLDPGATTNIITRSSRMNDDEDIPF